MARLPKQMLPYSEKSKNDFDWAKRTMDAILDTQLTLNANSKTKSDYTRMLSNYQLYNNQLNQEDFQRECNPLGLSIGQFQDEIQPYNKTYNKVQALLQEEITRPFNYRPVLVNSEGIKAKMMYRDQLIREFVLSQIKEALGLPYEEVLNPKQIQEIMETSYLESREIKAAKILDYLQYKLDLSYTKNEGFKHALISGYEMVYVGEMNGEPYVEILNPLYSFYHKSPETMYIQDGQYAGYRTRMTVSEILDRFGAYLSDDDKAELEEDYLDTARKVPSLRDLQNDSSYGNTVFNPGSHQSRNVSSYTWDVYHVEWRSYRRIGFLSFVNEYGDEVEEIVSEDFAIPSTKSTKTLTKDFGRKIKYFTWEDSGITYSLYWDYIPEIWTGVRIGSKMYCMIGPRKRQYRGEDNPQDIQLSYFGIAYSSMNSDPISLMDRMKPFQYLYFIVMHKLKKLIASDVGTIYNFDKSMVDPQIGLEKTLYYLKELNLNIFNSLQNADQPGFAQRSSTHSSTSWSNMGDIMNYVQLLAAIDQQISDVSGVTKQKEGLLLPNERVSNAQTAIQMSSLVTSVFFTVHDNLWQKILTHLVNVATDCFRDKKMVKQYVLDDLTLATLELSEPDLQDAEFGVFISNSQKDNQLFEALRSSAPDLIRSGKASFSDMISLYDAKSVEDLRNKIKVTEDLSLKSQQEQLQAKLESDREIEALKQEREDARKQLEVEGRIKVAEIQSFSRQMDQDINDNNVPDQLEVEKLRQNVRLKERELDIKEKELKIKEKATKNKPEK